MLTPERKWLRYMVPETVRKKLYPDPPSARKRLPVLPAATKEEFAYPYRRKPEEPLKIQNCISSEPAFEKLPVHGIFFEMLLARIAGRGGLL